MRRVATDLAALEQALAPYGLVPLHDDPTPPAQRDACASGYTVTRTGAGYIVTDAAGRVVAESIDLAMLRERAECAGDPVWTGNGGRETV